MSEIDLYERLARYRSSFDAAFAEPAVQRAAEGRLMLAIRAGDRDLAIAAEHVSHVDRAGRIAPLPGPAARGGVAAVRGRLVAVWDLATMLGRARGASESPWLLVAEPGFALAVDEFEGLRRVPPTSLHELGPNEQAGAYVVAVIRSPEEHRAVLSMDLLREAVRDLAGRREG